MENETQSSESTQEVQESSELTNQMKLQQAEDDVAVGASEASESEASKLIFGKYKTMEEAEKGHKAAERKMHEKQGDYTGTPEDGYSVLKHEGDEAQYNIDTESLAFQKLVADAKADNLSQKGLDKQIDNWTNYYKEMQGKIAKSAEAASKDAIDAEVKELGGWAAVEGMTDAISAGLLNEGLSQPQVNALVGGVTDAATVNALKQLVNERSYSGVPGSAGKPAVMDKDILMDRMRKAKTMHASERGEYDLETTRMFELAYPESK